MRVLILGLTLLLSGCWTPSAPSTVMVMGDSIAVSFSARLASILMGRNTAPLVLNNSLAGMVAAENGADVYWVGRIAEARKHVGNLDTLVVSLGGNDVGRLTRYEISKVLGPALNDIMYASRGLKVYWVVHADGKLPNLDEFRRVLYRAASYYSHVTVLDLPTGVLEADGIHLTQAGVTLTTNMLLTEMGY